LPKIGVTFSCDTETPMIKKFVSPEKSSDLTFELNPNQVSESILSSGDDKDNVSEKPSTFHNYGSIASAVFKDIVTSTNPSFGLCGSSHLVSTTQSGTVVSMPKTASCTITSTSAAPFSISTKSNSNESGASAGESSMSVKSEPKIFSSTNSKPTNLKSNIISNLSKGMKADLNDQNDESKENHNVNYEDCVSPWELNLQFNAREKRIRDNSGGDKTKIRDTVMENVEMMVINRKCFQCFRVFKDELEVRDQVAQKHHYCATEGNLRSPIEIDHRPTPTKQSSLTCIICKGSPKPVFKDENQLKIHITMAHKANFFKKELLRKNFTRVCVKGCGLESDTWEEAILHVAVEHEQLFWALKHDKKNDYRILIKRLFPVKYKNTPGLQWHRSKDEKKTAESTVNDSHKVKRKLNLDSKEVKNSQPSKIEIPIPSLVPKETSKLKIKTVFDKKTIAKLINRKNSSTSVDDIYEFSEEASTPASRFGKRKFSEDLEVSSRMSDSNKKRSKSMDADVLFDESRHRELVSSPAAKNEYKNQYKLIRQMKSVQCPICQLVLSNAYVRSMHLLKVHFFYKINKDYPLSGANQDKYPCGVDGCQKILKSSDSRIYHIGKLHGVLDRYLNVNETENKLKIIEEEVEPGVIICQYCWKKYPFKEYYSHDCVTMFCVNNNNNFNSKKDDDDSGRVLVDHVFIPDNDKNKPSIGIVANNICCEDEESGRELVDDDDDETNSGDGKQKSNNSDVQKMRAEINNICSESDEDDDSLNDGKRHPRLECEARNCDRIFRSKLSRDQHHNKCHTWDDF